MLRLALNQPKTENMLSHHFMLRDLKRIKKTGIHVLDFLCSGIQFYLLLSPHFCFISFIYLDLYVLGDDAWIS